VAHYDALFPQRPAVVAFLQRHLPATGRVLDVGCGPGRYAARLHGSGRTVVGLDVDPAMIDRARREHTGPRFETRDLRDVGGLDPGFAGAYSLGNVMAFLSPDRWPAFLGDLAGRLAPGSPWLFQTVNFDPLLGIPRHELPPLRLPDGEEVRRAYVARDDGSVEFRIRRVVRGAEVPVSCSTLYPQTAADYRRHHEAAGFAPVLHGGDFAGAPFDPAASGANVQVWATPK
jgi:SAM-dependent methyltransferase